MIALGLGLNAIIMSVGKWYWWTETLWIGWGLAFGIFSLIIAIIIELNRATPLVDLRWLFSKEMIEVVLVLLVFRILLLEQSTLAADFFNLFGLLDRDMTLMYLAVAFGTLLGGGVCVFFLRTDREDYFYLLSLSYLALGSYLDSYVSLLTRPVDMIMSQGLISFGYALFLPPALCSGFVKASAQGPNYVLSFIVIFLLAQVTGGFMSAALLAVCNFFSRVIILSI
ncbi:MAG: Inner-membrane proton/drug antiporter (MSF type) of tripartite multidrug efflux system [Bartonella clarridgeiae]|nr:MAG: Inner-membrane proton/drug antiporter (MSF type) of tripartite multidrug efflux system [Bartonella clarridgeiae]